MIFTKQKKILSCSYCSNGNQGFTLFEVIIVASLFAMAYVVVAPRLNTVFTANVEVKLGRLQSDFKSAFDMAMLHNKNFRLAFDFKSSTYWLEMTESKNIFLGDKSTGRDLSPKEVEEGLEEFEEKFEVFEDLNGQSRKDSETGEDIKIETPLIAAKDRLKELKFASWGAVQNLEWKRRSIGPNLVIMGVRAEHHAEYQSFEELADEGVAYIYFFPNGYIEKAYMHIGFSDFKGGIDDSKKPYTLVVDSYAGVVNIETGQKEVSLDDDT